VAEARHLHLDVRVPSDSLVINAPPEWLDRLLGVLLDNACKYAPDGGTVTVSVVPEKTRIGLVVDDTGPGIPEDERASRAAGPASGWRSPMRSCAPRTAAGGSRPRRVAEHGWPSAGSVPSARNRFERDGDPICGHDSRTAA